MAELPFLENVGIKNAKKNFVVFGLPGEYVFERIRETQSFYELSLLESIGENVQNGCSLIIDVGANLGNHALYFAGVLNSEVVAIEPDSLNFAILKENVQANGLERKVTMIRGAAWDAPTTVSLTQGIAGNRGTFSAVEADSDLEALRLDDLDLDRKVDVIKVDVEGGELRVLKGSRSIIERDRPVITVEAHDSESRSSLGSFLESFGYIAVSISGNSDNYLWIHSSVEESTATRATARAAVEDRRRLLRHSRGIQGQLQKISDKLESIDQSARNQGLDGRHSDVEVDSKRCSPSTAIEDIKEALSELNSSGRQFQQKEAVSPNTQDARIYEGYLREAVEGQHQTLDRIAAVESALVNSFREVTKNIKGTSSTLDEVGLAIFELQEKVSSLWGKVDSTDHRDNESNNRQDELSAVETLEMLIAGLREEVAALGEDLRESRAIEAEVRSSQILEVEMRTARGLLDRLHERIPEPDNVNSKLESVEERINDRIAGALLEIRKMVQGSDLPPRNELSDAPGPADKHCATEGNLPELLPDASEVFQNGVTSGRYNSDPANKLAKLYKAYGKLALRLEAIDSRTWSADELTRAVRDQLEYDPVDETEPSRRLSEPTASRTNVRRGFVPYFAGPPKRDRVRIGIASMAGREVGLKTVLGILAPQADEIFVYLNDMDEVPSILPYRENIYYVLGPDLGDRGKFEFLEGFHGYYLTCDDDISYAPFHVDSIVDGIERYGRNAVVGWHGSIFKPDFKEFYNAKYRQVLSFRFSRGEDTPVHLLGTGVSGFHTSTIDIFSQDFLYPNMADVFLAIAAKKQRVPMLVLAHGKDWATPIEVGPSISSVSLKKDKPNTAGLDVAATVSNLVKEHMPWSTIPVAAQYSRKPLSVALIGRTDRQKWKKGGILKSAHLTVDALRRFGVETVLEDVDTGDPISLNGRDADVVLVYVGDPARPDFKDVEKIVRVHAQKGRQVVVNLSYNGNLERSQFIVAKIQEWRRNFGGNIWLMVFTEAMYSLQDLQEVRDYMVIVPKTIALPDGPAASFRESEGIFLGDIAKMSDGALLGFPASEWIASIRRALPDVRLYALKQYKPKYDVKLDIDEVWPFLQPGEFAEKIGRTRLMLSMVKQATFEMVPLEVASLGVPVIYPEMPQSLNEHLGLSGVPVHSPDDLERILPTLYYDPIVWRSHSRAGVERAWSSELNRLAGHMYLRLISLVGRH